MWINYCLSPLIALSLAPRDDDRSLKTNDGLAMVIELGRNDWLVLKPEEVIRVCSAALAESTKRDKSILAAIYVKRAAAYEAQSDKAAALRDYQKAVDISPRNSDYRCDRAALLFSSNRVDQAKAGLESVVRDDPQFAPAYPLLAACYINDRDFAKAIELATKAIELDKSLWHGYYARGFALFFQKNYEEALPDLNRAIELRPMTDRAPEDLYVMRAIALRNSRRFNEGMQSLFLAKRLNPQSLNVWLEIWNNYASRGDYHLAVAAAEEFARLAPDRLESYLALGGTYAKVGRYQDALLALEKAKRQAPDNADVYYLLGSVDFFQKNYSDALNHWTKALEIDPEHILAMHEKALLLAVSPDDQLRDAASAKKLALAVCNRTKWKEPRPIIALAAAHAEAKEYDEALRFGEKALKLYPEDCKCKDSDREIVEAIRQRAPIRLDVPRN